MSVVRWIFAVIVVGLIGLAAVRSLKPHEPPPTKVRTQPVRKATITSTVRAAGKLEPVHKVNVSSNITGILLDLKVGIGSVVKKGQYLGQIDTTRYRAMVEQQRAQAAAAEAEVRRGEADLSRVKGVLERIGSAPGNAFNIGERENARTAVATGEAQLGALRSRVDSARATLRDAENSLQWATLKAPVDGTVLSVNHRVGERIRGSDFSEDVVLVLGSLSKMEVRIDVGEHDVVHIRPGLKAAITIDAMSKLTLDGEVLDSGRDAIIKNAGTDNEVTNYPVWVSMAAPPPGALSGMSAQVTIFTETKEDAVVVPIQAVTVRPREPAPGGPGEAKAPEKATDKAAEKAPEKATDKAPEKATDKAADKPVPGAPVERLQKVVFVVKDDKVEKRVVETGISSESLIEIVRGLAPGDVIVEGPYRVLARDLKDGMRIEVEKPEVEKGGPGGPPPSGEGHK